MGKGASKVESTAQNNRDHRAGNGLLSGLGLAQGRAITYCMWHSWLHSE